LGKRLEKLRPTRGVDLAEQIRVAWERLEEPERAWCAAGNIGRPPPDPLRPLPSTASAHDRKTWRQIAHGRARVLHRSGELPSPFKDLSEAYDMSDGDLMQAINKAEQSR
jgi:hypothetical protein